MLYIKTFDAEGVQTGAQALAEPCYVRWYVSNGMMARCDQAEAQGVIGTDGEAYLLDGQMPHGIQEPRAEIITEAEYRAIIDEDPEDEDPVIPDPEPEEPPMTRAELTARLLELEAQTSSMTAKDNYPQGSYFVLHDEVYRATDPISKGSEIRPGYNCEKKSLDEFLNQEGE